MICRHKGDARAAKEHREERSSASEEREHDSQWRGRRVARHWSCATATHRQRPLLDTSSADDLKANYIVRLASRCACPGQTLPLGHSYICRARPEKHRIKGETGRRTRASQIDSLPLWPVLSSGEHDKCKSVLCRTSCATVTRSTLCQSATLPIRLPFL